MRNHQNRSSKQTKGWEMKLFYCFFKNKCYENNKAQQKVNLNLKRWWKNFVTENNIGCLAVITVKLKEHIEMHVAFLYPLKTSETLKVFWCFQWV